MASNYVGPRVHCNSDGLNDIWLSMHLLGWVPVSYQQHTGSRMEEKAWKTTRRPQSDTLNCSGGLNCDWWSWRAKSATIHRRQCALRMMMMMM